MRQKSLGWSRACLPLLVLAGLAGGCASNSAAETEEERVLPAPASVTEETRTSAKIVTIDPATRQIGLRAEDGETWIVRAGPEVRNFDQLKPGDTVVVRASKAMAVELVPKGMVGTTDAAVAAARAKPGEKPGAGIAAGITTLVRIESVDTVSDIVVFSGASGGLRALRVQRQEGRDFLRGLKRGDLVQISYVEGVAVSVEKP